MSDTRAKYRFQERIGLFAAASTLAAGGYIVILTVVPKLTNLPVISKVMTETVTEKLQSTYPASPHNRLYIQKIGVDVAIVTGNDEEILQHGAWHRKPQNGDPIKGGNFVLSAHRFQMGYTPAGTVAKSPFYNIDKLGPGDSIIVDYDGSRHIYEIVRKYKVDPRQVEIEERSDVPKLTLYSCTFRGSADGRDVIEAVPK